MAERSTDFWKCAFKGYEDIDPRVKKAIMLVYQSYPMSCMPNGVCDPMYIMNVIALELGIGDGKGQFNLPPVKGEKIC